LIVPGLDIEYRGDPSLPYGASATKAAEPFEFIICHYTGSDAKFENIVRYTLRVDPERGGQFGYHFLIDVDGRVVQTAPLTKRTNHIKSNPKIGVSNANAIGISLHRPNETPTAAQLAAGFTLGVEIARVFDIPIKSVFGHGEVNSHKAKDEGITLARALRGR
jgi:N-acetyl-anhydromuramyl-L-alanine amidase AmpD